jgi:hypothetical protein
VALGWVRSVIAINNGRPVDASVDAGLPSYSALPDGLIVVQRQSSGTNLRPNGHDHDVVISANPPSVARPLRFDRALPQESDNPAASVGR